MEYTLRETIIVEAEDEEDAETRAYESLDWSGMAECIDHRANYIREAKGYDE